MKLFVFDDLGRAYIVAAHNAQEACKVLIQFDLSVDGYSWMNTPVVPERMQELPFCQATCKTPRVIR